MSLMPSTCQGGTKAANTGETVENFTSLMVEEPGTQNVRVSHHCVITLPFPKAPRPCALPLISVSPGLCSPLPGPLCCPWSPWAANPTSRVALSFAFSCELVPSAASLSVSLSAPDRWLWLFAHLPSQRLPLSQTVSRAVPHSAARHLHHSL